MTSSGNTPAYPDQPDPLAGEGFDIEMAGHSVPPADDPDNPGEGPYGE